MAADTLTDAEAAHLRSVRENLGLPWSPRVATGLYHRGLLELPAIGGFDLTSAGLEALAAHEARHEAGDRRG